MLCCRVFPAAEKLWISRGRGHQVFPSKIFRLTVQESIVGEPFSMSLFSGNGKFHS